MRVLLAIGLMLIAGACATNGLDQSGAVGIEAIDEMVAARIVRIDTTACGFASGTSGAGVVVGDGQILTAAHVVVGAGSVSVTAAHPQPGEEPSALDARVVRFDAEADLALLDVPGLREDGIVLADADSGDVLRAGGGGPSGRFTTTVLRRVEIRIEGVRSTERGSRFGYEVDQRVELGDSGGGLFNGQGELVAVVFGRSQERADASFAVRRAQIEALLSETADKPHSCDPNQNRVIAE